jgi:hypothetical protein
MTQDQEVARRRVLRERLLYHERQTIALQQELADLECAEDRRKIELALETIDKALSRDIPVPDGEYGEGMKRGVLLACEEIRRVLLHE